MTASEHTTNLQSIRQLLVERRRLSAVNALELKRNNDPRWTAAIGEVISCQTQIEAIDACLSDEARATHAELNQRGFTG